MSIFQTTSTEIFNQAKWENEIAKSQNRRGIFKSNLESVDSNQFILLQLSDGEQRILNTTQVVPKLQGSDEKPDINMKLDFEGFRIGSNEDIEPDTKATLQLQIGQEHSAGELDKLFYCINGGLDLYNKITGKPSESKDFKKSTADALGKKPISLPEGAGEITLSVVKHEEPKWWQKIFSFAQSDTGQDLISLIGFPGVTKTAVNCLSGMLDKLFDDEPDILFQSRPVKLAFTQSAKDDLSSGLATNLVSCLNEGIWVMARKEDYKTIIDSKPKYFIGYGILAPDEMNEIEALDDKSNPFSKITYAIIKAKMKEVDLKEGML